MNQHLASETTVAKPKWFKLADVQTEYARQEAEAARAHQGKKRRPRKSKPGSGDTYTLPCLSVFEMGSQYEFRVEHVNARRHRYERTWRLGQDTVKRVGAFTVQMPLAFAVINGVVQC